MDWRRDLVRVAKRQEGVFSRAQLRELAVPRSSRALCLRRGLWEQALPGVFRIAGAPQTWRQRVMEGCLWAGPESGASHLTAAWLWQLDGLGLEPPNEIEVSLPHSARVKTAGVTLHRTRSVPDGTWNFNGRIPVTNLARTLLDLSSVLDEERLELALDSAMRKKKKLLPWLQQQLAAVGTRGREGAGILARLVQVRASGGAHDSALEVKVTRALRRAGIPEPRRQQRIHDHQGRYIGAFDFAWPEARLVLESDGWGFHGNRDQWERDNERRNRLTALGIAMITVTWRSLHTSDWLEQVRDRLGEAGVTAP